MRKFLVKNADYFYFLFRVIIGLLFFLHGIAKMPGILNGSTSLFTLIAVAGIIELIGGAFIFLGIFTRSIALITALEMLVAYFMFHASKGWNPLTNKGELALLYFASFLILIAFGSRIWAIENLWKK